MIAMRILLTLLGLCFLPACLMSQSERHTPLDPAAVATIRPGETTVQNVLDLLGAPNEVVQLGKRSAFRYDYSVEKQSGLFLIVVALLGTDTQQDRAWIFFGETGLVTHAGSTFDAQTAEYALPGMGD